MKVGAVGVGGDFTAHKCVNLGGVFDLKEKMNGLLQCSGPVCFLDIR